MTGRWRVAGLLLALLFGLGATGVPAQSEQVATQEPQPLAETVDADADQRPPIAVWLVIPEDATSEIVVNWVVRGPALGGAVRWDVTARNGDPALYSKRAVGTVVEIPGAERLLPSLQPINADELGASIGRYTVYRATIGDLEADQQIWFVVGGTGGYWSFERSAKTFSDDPERPFRFFAGGDLEASDTMRRLAAVTATHSPDALVLGGDLAYANGVWRNWSLWLRFLTTLDQELVTPEGLTVPMILAVGNHEVNRGRLGGVSELDPDQLAAPFWFALFDQHPGRSYFRRRLAPEVVFYVLDSNHLTPHAGLQAQWLQQQFENDGRIRNKFATYHVPLYPSHRGYTGDDNEAGRSAWRPIFDRYRLTAAFEHHDHTFKRTHPLNNNRVVSPGRGTIYLGDGSMGRGERKVDDERRFYLARWGQIAHVWQVDVLPSGVITYKAFNEWGAVFDQYGPGINSKRGKVKKGVEELGREETPD